MVGRQKADEINKYCSKLIRTSHCDIENYSMKKAMKPLKPGNDRTTFAIVHEEIVIE